jgi:hypothetical protein
MKKVLLFLFLIFNGLIFAQNVEISVGYIFNTFYDLEEENPHYRSDYSGGNGGAIKLSIEKFKLADSIVPIRLEISYTNYKGHAEIMRSSLGGGSTEYADINKSVLGLTIYPLLFRIKKSFRIDLGLEMDILLLDKSKGYYQSWSMNVPHKTGEISDLDNESTTYGVIFQTGYEFAIKNNWFIYPRYHLYIGLSKDYCDAKSLRNQFEVGLIKRMK